MESTCKCNAKLSIRSDSRSHHKSMCKNRTTNSSLFICVLNNKLNTYILGILNVHLVSMPSVNTSLLFGKCYHGASLRLPYYHNETLNKIICTYSALAFIQTSAPFVTLYHCKFQSVPLNLKYEIRNSF